MDINAVAIIPFESHEWEHGRICGSKHTWRDIPKEAQRTTATFTIGSQGSANLPDEAQWRRINENGVLFKVHQSGRTPLLIAAMRSDVALVCTFNEVNG